METEGANNRRPEKDQAVEAMDTQESDVINDPSDIDNLSNNGDANMQYAPDTTTQTVNMDTQPTVDPEEEVKSEATFEFVVENFSKLKESILSEPCYVRNLPWKIMVMPRSDRNQPETRSLGFFLQCNGESDSTSWSCHAVAELRLKSWKPGVDPFIRKIKHLFYNKENDWGFSYFMSWNEIFDPEKGYIQNDAIRLEVYVSAEAPHGVFWDSKKHTGYVGLKNQGATCYMNSLLQTLYFTNHLRKAVYKMPTEADDSSKSVALALQRVFHDLQYCDKQVGTKKLTKSFGWETLDSFMQHDVQEFLRVLLDKVEVKMKGTCVEGTVPFLFEGKMTSFIKCKNIDYNSCKGETFYDIQLNIKGKKDIYESFQDYVATETLEGDNKYDAGIHGFQEAEKGVKFIQFPPVLHLHLMRFQYDPITDNSVKFNDRFEFYEEIDLDEFCDKDVTPAKYRLHAVLVHSGDNHGGHYVVYINPPGDGKSWYKFDDDVVSTCSKAEAIDQNFGGVDDDMSLNAKHCSNAYMLVYIRESAKETVLEEIKEDDIPSELLEKLKEEKRMEMARRRERSESNQCVQIHVVLEEYFEGHLSADLYDPDKIHYRVFKMKKTQTVHELMKVFCDTFKVGLNRMRLWTLISRPSQVTRPIYIDTIEESNRSLSSLIEPQGTWTVFLELASPELKGSLPSFDKKRDILLFFKFYDPIQKHLNYLGYEQYSLQKKLCDLLPDIKKRLGFLPDTELTIYEEHGPSIIPKTNNLNDTLEKALKSSREDVNGSILIFEKEQYDKKLELPTCDDYFRDLLYRFEITFVDKNNPNDPGFTLELSHRNTYEHMAQAVAQKINTEPNKIQFFKPVGYKEQPGNPLRYSNETSLKDLLTNKPKPYKKLFYQRLSMSLNELESKKQFKCLWITPNLKEEKELILYPNKSGTVKHLLEEATKQVDFSDDGTRKLRLVEILSHKLLPVPKEDTPLEELQSASDAMSNQTSQKCYRIEEIPRDEEHLNDDEMLIPVSHFQKEIYNSFGIPFFIKAKQGETYGSLKERIQKKLNVPDKEWEKYKFSFISMGRSENITDDSATINLDLFRPNNTQTSAPLPYLGLEHINKSQKRSRYTYLEKAIKIYN